VAATRAKFSLTVLTDGAHPFLPANLPAVLARKVQQGSAILPRAHLRYVTPRLEDMFLSFAGHLKTGDASLAAIATAQVGQPVQMVQRAKTWAICTVDGTLLARFANNFAPPEGAVFLRGQITAVLNWRSKDSGEDYRHLNKRDEWEVILPELVFEMP
jgi:ATP-dependent DNA helicase RecQ